MKYLFLSLMIFSLLLSCSKDCENSDPTCTEVPPTNEACAAYFTRWFYNESKNTCEQLSYSGCSAWGFSTKQECEACECN